MVLCLGELKGFFKKGFLFQNTTGRSLQLPLLGQPVGVWMCPFRGRVLHNVVKYETSSPLHIPCVSWRL